MTLSPGTTKLICIGLSHETSTVMDREQFSCLDSSWLAARLPELPGLEEWVVLSTCNRVELYLGVRGDTRSTVRQMMTDLEGIAGAHSPGTADMLFAYEGDEVAHHLLTVASGLDSMVVGESEILGQVSSAFSEARANRTVGPVLDALFLSAIRTGRRSRSETALGCTAASVSSVALELAAERLGDLSQCRVAVIGMGAMGQVSLKILRSKGARNVTLVNRSIDKARSIATSDWRVRSMGEMSEVLGDVDLAITATAAPHPVITMGDLHAAISKRTASQNGHSAARPLVIIDMAMPRDVEPDAAAISGVEVFNLDDLHRGIDQAIEYRRQAIPEVRRIIQEELEQFLLKKRELEVRPVVVALRTRAEHIRQQELARTLRHLGEVDPETKTHLQHLTRALVNKLLHEPTARIKELAQDGRSAEYVDAFQELFGLDADSPAQ